MDTKFKNYSDDNFCCNVEEVKSFDAMVAEQPDIVKISISYLIKGLLSFLLNYFDSE